jgi:putative redox protein
MVHIELNRVVGNFGFEAKDANGHIVKLDTTESNGGNNFGASPMQTLLMALGGCSAIDVVSILNKQRQIVIDFNIKIDAEREQGKEPALWKYVKIHFFLKGELDYDKAYRACQLSMEKYCSVGATLMLAGCKIDWELQISE